MRRHHLTIAVAAVGLTSLLAASASAEPQDAKGSPRGRGAASPVVERAAAGEVDAFGGARRLDRDQTRTIQAALQRGPAKNVILIIGDGMGASEITIGRNYLVGAGGYLPGLDALPLTGQMTHYTVDKETGKPDYVGDSAATGTAWATGVKTYDNAVSVDRHEKPYETILQFAKKQGMATGNVSTSEIQDATPAVLIANVPQRKGYGPGPPPRTARRSRWRTAARDPSRSSCSPPAPTSRSAAAPRPSRRRPRPGTSRIRRWRTRRAPAGSTTSPRPRTSPASRPPTRTRRCSACSPRATCR